MRAILHVDLDADIDVAFLMAIPCVPRTKCEDCGVKQFKVPCARKGSGFTLMDSMIVLMAQHMTLAAIAEMR